MDKDEETKLACVILSASFVVGQLIGWGYLVTGNPMGDAGVLAYFVTSLLIALGTSFVLFLSGILLGVHVISQSWAQAVATVLGFLVTAILIPVLLLHLLG